MDTAWTNADANSDGKLNEAEYAVFNEAMRKIAVDNGEWIEAEANNARNYAIFNSVSEGEGFTMAELIQV